MKFSVGSGESQFGKIPAGQYVAKFLGVTMLEDAQPRIGQDGKPMPPAMAWEFEVTEGEHAGQKASRITGRTPTGKNMCGRFLGALSGTYLKQGIEVDLDPFVGRLYRITVEPNESGEKTRVADNPPPIPHTGPMPAPAAPPLPGKPGAPRPPVRNQQPTPAAPPLLWVSFADGQVTDKALSKEEAGHLLFSKSIKVEDAMACAEGTQDWKPAVEFGIAHPF